MNQASASRVESLDLIRGLAVLGILAINVAGFAGPSAAVLTPHIPVAGSAADEWAFALNFIVFEGKMRALFSLLFGAGIVLFVERADEAGKFGDVLQLRRLGWLAVFGLAHYYLLWWGDILFIYALAGIAALFMREMAMRPLVISALAIFAIWHAAGAALTLPGVMLEDRVIQGTATGGEARDYAAYLEAVDDNARGEMAQVSGTFADQAGYRALHRTFQPLFTALANLGETVPMMMLGMALMRSGFFTGAWPRRRMLVTAWAATGAGLGLTLLLLDWAWARHFPPRAMEEIFKYWTALPHLLMGVGYAAALVLLTHSISRTQPGRWLRAAGRMAFSNYIASSVLMTGLFYGWGLGWMGRFGPAWQWPFVLLGWSVLLVWSMAWLSRFPRGPLEWAWRSLTEGRRLPFTHPR